jgi:ABC-type glycerol-3-phosphate transport system substrate-binding protein
VAAALAAAGCGSSEDDDGQQAGGVVEITCAACQESASDPFLQYNHDLAERFNEQYAGRYRIKVVQNQYAGSSPDRAQYYQRLALADDLPDVFQLTQNELRALVKTGKVDDLTADVDGDPAWKDSFYPGVFDALTQDGKVYAVPEQRDAIGIYYNKALLADAGVDGFPETWDELDAACEQVKRSGKACLAMDGDWTTLLMWANLIGTAPDGATFLTEGIAAGDYASNDVVVQATERLKRWHTEGLTNEDAFSGDYQDAAAPYVAGDAAMIANGPWMVSTDIKGKDAAPEIYKQSGYAPSPGYTADQRGVIIVAGEGGWVSGAQSDREHEAVVAFLKFLTSRDESLEKTKRTGAYPPIEIDYTAQESKQLEPLAAELVKEAGELPLTFPHVYFNAPTGFAAAWKNLWPAYVKGDLDTDQFLSQLGDDATSPTG